MPSLENVRLEVRADPRPLASRPLTCITHPCGAVLEYLSWNRLELTLTRGNPSREELTILASGACRLCTQRDSSTSINCLFIVASDTVLANETVTSVDGVSSPRGMERAMKRAACRGHVASVV
jgi:hypothetical protein